MDYCFYFHLQRSDKPNCSFAVYNMCIARPQEGASLCTCSMEVYSTLCDSKLILVSFLCACRLFVVCHQGDCIVNVIRLLARPSLHNRCLQNLFWLANILMLVIEELVASFLKQISLYIKWLMVYYLDRLYNITYTIKWLTRSRMRKTSYLGKTQ